MLKLPVYHSVISSHAIVPVINDLYEIGDVLECSFYENGLNDTYLLKTSIDKYILRIYKAHWRNKHEIDFEVELLNHLNKKNIPVSAPIISKDGGYLIELEAPEGTRYAVLFTFAKAIIPMKKLAVNYTVNKWLRCIWLWMISNVGSKDLRLIWIICFKNRFNRFASLYPTGKRISII